MSVDVAMVAAIVYSIMPVIMSEETVRHLSQWNTGLLNGVVVKIWKRPVCLKISSDTGLYHKTENKGRTGHRHMLVHAVNK